ncbi:MAG: hypothetical protein R2939_21340 [Kofleriaceae bacterium]
MRASTSLAALSLSACALSACTLFFTGDGDDAPCVGDEAPAPALGARDPDTGACEAYGGGGGGCGGGGASLEPAPLDWAICPGPCEGLSEAVCLDQPACRAAYLGCEACEDPPGFVECWGVAPSGPVAGTRPCAEEDAHGCSRRDDCSAVYVEDPTPAAGGGDADALQVAPWRFLQCVAEAEITCGVSAEVCASDATCELVCDPSGGCAEQCVAERSDACVGVICGAGMACAVEPGSGGAVCVNGGGGACDGVVTCELVPPACPSGTTPGVRDGCYTGYCVPTSACDAP